ncbi:MAG: hypothetical protein GEU78_16235 [Actinobacteria bacterium]|nr:hypothetical protein [Actinomycetota bacterium]
MTAARQAIIDAGGEPKSVETLKHYRETALWVRFPGEPNRYQWIDDASFTAHRRAWAAGMSYEDFIALPIKTGDAVNEFVGKGAIRGTSTIKTWSPEQKAAAARELLDDPDIADDVDDWATQRVVQRHAERTQHRPPRGSDKPLRRAMTEMELTLLSKLNALDHFAGICRDINENEVDLDPETFGKLTAVAQQIVVEIQFYAIRHGLDCDLKVAQ